MEGLIKIRNVEYQFFIMTTEDIPLMDDQTYLEEIRTLDIFTIEYKVEGSMKPRSTISKRYLLHFSQNKDKMIYNDYMHFPTLAIYILGQLHLKYKEKHRLPLKGSKVLQVNFKKG